MKIENIKELENIAKQVRRGIIEQVYIAKSGHPGGALSIADILTVLYFNQMNINEKEPNAPLRDRLVLSKGHCVPALYATLAQRGFLDKEDLKTFRNIDGNLQGHPDMNKVPGIDMTTGSLGQGLSAANGMAISAKLDNKDYCISCYQDEIENKHLEIEYLKNNTLVRKVLNPFAYVYLFFKSKPNDLLLNIKLYKSIKNSKCFDIGFYLNNNDDIQNSKWCKTLD